MTVVKDKNNEGHAVLTVKTDHGDFVLDNLHGRGEGLEADPLSLREAAEPVRPEHLGLDRRADPAPAYVSR